jgi:hypothetical protein
MVTEGYRRVMWRLAIEGKGHSEGACHERMGGEGLTTFMGCDYFRKGGW